MEEFWAIPKDIQARKDISQGAKVAYGILYTRRNGENVAWPSQAHMADVLNVDEKTLRKYLGELKERGLIEPKREGLRRTNRYKLNGVSNRAKRPVKNGQNARSRTGAGSRSHSKRRVEREDSKSEDASLAEELQDELGFELT